MISLLRTTVHLYASFYARDAADSLALIHHFAGKYSPTAGNDKEADCIECGAGKYSVTSEANSSRTCLDCPVGKYLPTSGNNAESDCVVCEPGKYSSETGYQSDTSCITCPLGYSCEGGKDKVRCPAATAFGWSYCPFDFCASLGCDGVPNSAKVVDICGVCGGVGIVSGTCNCHGDTLDQCGVCDV